MRTFFSIMGFIIAQIAILIGSLVLTFGPALYLESQNIIVNKNILAVITLSIGVINAVSIQVSIMDKLNDSNVHDFN